MLYNVEVKTDSQRVWRKLSIKMRSSEALKDMIEDLIIQYAIDNQLNYHTLSARIVDEDNKVIYQYDSNCIANKV